MYDATTGERVMPGRRTAVTEWMTAASSALVNRLVCHRNFGRLVAALLLGLAAGLRARAASSTGLLETSPFLPPNSAAGASQENHPLELRGIFKDGPVYQFSIYDTTKKRSLWVKLDQSGHDFVIKSFDAAHEAVTVEQQNRTYVLTLKKAKIVPLSATAVAGRPVPHGMVPGQALPPGERERSGPVPIGAGVVNGGNRPPIPTALTPEQLRNLEADINRRRELRRQAAEAMARRRQQQQ